VCAAHQVGAIAEIEFVAFSVAAEVIVIVEKEDAVRARVRAVERRGRKSGDARTQEDEIVLLAGGRGWRGIWPAPKHGSQAIVERFPWGGRQITATL
jgi:hypothetical protein